MDFRCPERAQLLRVFFPDGVSADRFDVLLAVHDILQALQALTKNGSEGVEQGFRLIARLSNAAFEHHAALRESDRIPEPVICEHCELLAVESPDPIAVRLCGRCFDILSGRVPAPHKNGPCGCPKPVGKTVRCLQCGGATPRVGVVPLAPFRSAACDATFRVAANEEPPVVVPLTEGAPETPAPEPEPAPVEAPTSPPDAPTSP